MKISKIASAVVLTMGVASFAAQADQGSGKVTFWGSIIDAPCSIKNGYGDQRIELGQISNTHLTAVFPLLVRSTSSWKTAPSRRIQTATRCITPLK